MRVSEIMTREPVTVRRGAGLDHAMELMLEHDIRHLPVVDDEGLVGVVSDRDLAEATGWLAPRQREVLEAPERAVRDVMHAPPVTVAPDDPITAALARFVEQHIGCVPVVDGGRLVGLVTEVDLLRAYADACRHGDVAPEADPRLAAHMTRDPETIDGDASGDELAARLAERRVRHLPVTRDGELIGIVSDRDVRRLRGRGRLELALVQEMMSPSPQTATPDERLSSAALILTGERISALPVVDDGRLVGIVTTRDATIACARLLQRL